MKYCKVGSLLQQQMLAHLFATSWSNADNTCERYKRH
jgi:hypothetical protein